MSTALAQLAGRVASRECLLELLSQHDAELRRLKESIAVLAVTLEDALKWAENDATACREGLFTSAEDGQPDGCFPRHAKEIRAALAKAKGPQ